MPGTEETKEDSGAIRLTLREIAEHLDGEIIGDSEGVFTGAAPFESADSHQITWAGQAKWIKRIGETGAGAVIVPPDIQSDIQSEIGGGEKPLIRVENPYAAFARAANLFYRPRLPGYMVGGRVGFQSGSNISRLAVVGRDTNIGEEARIGPCAVIGDRVKIGPNAVIHPHVVIEDDVIIGRDAKIFPSVTIGWGTRIGDRVAIHAGTVIGSDGFGYAPSPEGYIKIPHIGVVEIGDDVEIGACNTIDRATFGVTRIGRGVKTDNLVQVAHNVSIGEHTVLVAQVGIAGSTKIGKRAILAGQAGISGHLTLGDNVTVGPQCGVGKSISDGQVVSGSPEIPHRNWLRVQRVVPQLPELKKRLEKVEKRLKEMEDGDEPGERKSEE